jgi:hypothetical protein
LHQGNFYRHGGGGLALNLTALGIMLRFWYWNSS